MLRRLLLFALRFVCADDWEPMGCLRMKPKGGAWAGKCTERDRQIETRPLESGVRQGPEAMAPVLAGVKKACPRKLPFASAGPGYESMAPLDAVLDRLRVTVEGLRAP